jgi:hypothetical protein
MDIMDFGVTGTRCGRCKCSKMPIDQVWVWAAVHRFSMSFCS